MGDDEVEGQDFRELRCIYEHAATSPVVLGAPSAKYTR